MKALALLVQDQLEMRGSLAARGKTLAKDVNRNVQDAADRQLAKQSYRKLLFPPCAGESKVESLANPDGFLALVSEHRSPPVDLVNLPTLVCLEGTGYGPRCQHNGPGTNRLLAENATNPGNKRRLQTADSAQRLAAPKDENPMGTIVPPDVSYVDLPRASTCQSKCLSDGSIHEDGLSLLSSGPDSRPGTGFSIASSQPNRPLSRSERPHSRSRKSTDKLQFAAEQIAIAVLDCDKHFPGSRPGEQRTGISSSLTIPEAMPNAGTPPRTEKGSNLTTPKPTPAGTPPQEMTALSLATPASLPSFSQTQPVFGKAAEIKAEKASVGLTVSRSLPTLATAQNGASSGSEGLRSKLRPGSGMSKSSSSRSIAPKRPLTLSQSFARVMVGKSIVVLTDSPHLRKTAVSAFNSDDATLVFTKSSHDLWTKLRDTKECYHALLIDLSKRELQVEQLLHVIREDRRYGSLPIVALSAEMDIPEVVRQYCTYVVYTPLSNVALRQALLWCLDRLAAMKLAGPVESSGTSDFRQLESEWKANALAPSLAVSAVG